MKFNYPQGITVNSSGNVYVADTSNHRIQKFDANGNFITKWGTYGSADGQFDYPRGIAIDTNGNVYVLDEDNYRIQKFDASGNFVTKWGSYGCGDGQFEYPMGIAVDTSGNVYVADYYNHRIQKFNVSGTFIAKWGSYGSGNGRFSSPTGIAVDSSGNVFVADYYNNRIQKFDSNGNFITKWGSSGSGDGQFYYPMGIAVDSSGNVYVADYDNNRIQKFDASGNFLTKCGSYGSGDGQFYYPMGVVINNSGNMYVADTYNHRIQKFTLIQGVSYISGYIKTSSDVGIASTTVTLSGTTNATCVTSSSGYYIFDYLPSTGTYTVTPTHQDYSFSPLTYTYPTLPNNMSNQNFTGRPATIAVDPVLLDFGEVTVDKTMYLTISNSGGGTLQGTLDKNQSWIEYDTHTFTGNNTRIAVTIFARAVEHNGRYNGMLKVTSNGGTATVNVTIAARCVLTKPNPYNPRNGVLKFYGSGVVPNETSIKIMTLSGEHVETLNETNGSNEIAWDGKNEDGEQVTTGMYLYASNSPKEKWFGKFTVIKK